jgi:pilus assembly protein CpaE
VDTTHLVVIEGPNRQISAFVRKAGLEVTSTLSPAQIPDLEGAKRLPDVIVLDLRGQTSLPSELTMLKRRHPRIGVIIVATALDPNLMLEAMRAGVNEFVTEPLQETDLREAVGRIVGYQLAPAGPGNVLAFVGAKGGVGTTTLAVNVATALAADKTSSVLVVDLHVAAHGDAALLLGVEPRFSVADALDNINRLDASYLSTIVVRSKAGVDLLASPERPSMRPPEPERVKQLLQRLAEHYSCVVLDVPRSDFGIIDALEPLSAVVLLVNQELPTVRRAAQIGALLRQRYGRERVGTVVSRYDVRADIGQDDIERVVGLPVWATLPSDYRKVLAAANSGQPLVTDTQSRLATAIVQLAKRLHHPVAATAPASKPAKTGGRFRLL